MADVEKIVKAGSYFAWSDSLMMAEGECRVTKSSCSGDFAELCSFDMGMEEDEGRKLMQRIARLLNKDTAHCEVCEAKEDLSECACGKVICADCTDTSIYCDQDLCAACAAETREGWEQCKGHEFDDPYENEIGDTVQECKHCGFGQAVTLPPATSACSELDETDGARKS